MPDSMMQAFPPAGLQEDANMDAATPWAAASTYTAPYQAPGANAGHIPLSQELMYLPLVHPEPHHTRFDPPSTSTCCASASRRSRASSGTSATG
ncbi:MAG TPA: hypothetical protein VE269_02580 [Gaiellaceae bacterium]|nr:hypothetical protein [Gaiellaceae bacterium]